MMAKTILNAHFVTFRSLTLIGFLAAEVQQEEPNSQLLYIYIGMKTGLIKWVAQRNHDQ